MRFRLLTFILLTSVSCFGQILEDVTKILDEPQGEPLFELEAKQHVYSFVDDEGWYKVRKEIWVKRNMLIEDEYLGEGTELFNKEGDKIGVCLNELKVADKRLVEGFRGKDRYQIILEGFIFRTKIKDGTIPEDRISELLAIKNRTQQKKGFEDLFELYAFEKAEYNDLNVAVMRATNKEAKEEKDFRVIVIYRGSTLYGVICNEHEVTAPKIKMTYENGRYKGIYFYKPTSKQKMVIEEEIVYDFLAL